MAPVKVSVTDLMMESMRALVMALVRGFLGRIRSRVICDNSCDGTYQGCLKRSHVRI